MTLTKELPSEQLRSLDLHSGDSLRVVAELGETVLVEITRAETNGAPPLRMSAGAWARTYLGAAKPAAGESTEDARLAHFREKYGA